MSVHQMKVTLAGIDPPIWRRLQVRSRTSLAELHSVLQWTMGWEDCHLHAFGLPRQPRWRKARIEMIKEADEAVVTLDQLAVGGRLLYVYDFGDDWVHELVVEEVCPAQDEVAYPRCLDGARACPPEDCGGWPGYHDMLQALRERRGPRYREIRQFLGGARFDAEAFRVAAVNRQLAKLHEGRSSDPPGQARTSVLPT